MIEVLHTIGSLGVGGIQTYLSDLSRYDDKYGISRSLLCLETDKGELKQKFLKNNVKIFECTIMPKDYGLRPYRFWKVVRKLRTVFFILRFYKKIKLLKPKIIVCENSNQLVAQIIVSKLLCKNFIWYIHNEYQLNNVNKTLFNWVVKYFATNQFSIISSSRFILEKNLGSYQKQIANYWDKIPIIHASVDFKALTKVHKRKNNRITTGIHLGSIGRLIWQKDYEFLIEVFSSLKKIIDREIYLSIGGVGPLKNSLTQLIEKLDLERNVKLEGHITRKELPIFLSNIDIYIQSSCTESAPITIKEAMAASLPIISTDVGGISEVIINGKTGFLIPYGSKEKFIKGLVQLIDMEPKKKQELGLNARQYALRHFSIDKLAKQNAEFYKKQLSLPASGF